MIEYQNIKTDLSVNEKLYSKWLKAVLKAEGYLEGQIGYLFCNDEYLLQINQQFLNHDTLTDIVTFPLTDSKTKIVSGEIYISIERVRENANKFQVSFEKELSRVLVHGILHLMGYDDHTDDDILQMRQKEDYYLSLQPEK